MTRIKDKFKTFSYISETLKSCQDRNLLDLKIICQDGSIYWSCFLMASASNMMKSVLSQNQDSEEVTILMPGISKDSVQMVLSNLVNMRQDFQDVDASIVELFAFDFPKGMLKCTFEGCTAEFQRKLHLQRHQASHSKERQFVCDQCGKVFYHEDNLRLHMRYHNDLMTAHTCPHCQYVFYGRRALQSHIDDHHAPLVPCPVCDKSVKKRFLLRHLRSRHKDLTDKGNNLRRTLERLKSKEKPLKRPKESVSDNAIEELIQSQDKRVRCQYCDKTFANQYIAKYHIEKIHDKKNIHQKELHCTICEKKFIGLPPSRLARHMREVHAENRFECNECGHFFPVKASLERHLSTVHHPQHQECPYCHVRIIHLSAHLMSSHGMASAEARTLATEISGKSAARTNLPFEEADEMPIK